MCIMQGCLTLCEIFTNWVSFFQENILKSEAENVFIFLSINLKKNENSVFYVCSHRKMSLLQYKVIEIGKMEYCTTARWNFYVVWFKTTFIFRWW